jgi:hypothetical protein
MLWTSHELVEMLRRYSGQRFLGAVDCGDCMELVFSRAADRGNLLCLYESGRHSDGSVTDPEGYVGGAPDWPLRAIRLDSLEWADHIAEIVERRLRLTDDPVERSRLRALRDFHYATFFGEEKAA